MTKQERVEIAADLEEAWEALFRLREMPTINTDAAMRKRETENRQLRELQRLSLLAVSDA